jgi:hypothetical protein
MERGDNGCSLASLRDAILFGDGTRGCATLAPGYHLLPLSGQRSNTHFLECYIFMAILSDSTTLLREPHLPH